MTKLEPTRTSSDLTAIERLRSMLDERGVEYTANERDTQWWPKDNPAGVLAENSRYPHGTLDVYGLDPEQAIAATLGTTDARPTQAESSWTCHNASKVMDEHGQARFACSECGAWIDSRMLWNPEYRNGESPWVSGCKLNYCPNCGRKVVDA